VRNYNEKQRDMLRSILPATNRRSVRFDAAVIKRQNRRATHIAEIADRLHKIIASGFHGDFNNDLDFETVPLAGLHDCERFAETHAYNRKIEKIIKKWENMMA
jgi:hypothetical protein